VEKSGLKGIILFRGVNNINLDAKGRFAIPTRYREELRVSCASQLVATIDDSEKCLLVYPLPEWEKIERKLVELPSMNKQVKKFKRLLIGHATDCDMDGQGRVLLTAPLRKFAELNKKAVLIGQGNKFELWDEETWNTRRDEWLEEESLEDSDDLAPELGSLSF